MNIKRTERFKAELSEILRFIAVDSPTSATAFKEGIRKVLEGLSYMPYKYRKSTKADDDTIRDLVYNGYVIPYRVKDDAIEILGVFSQNEWEL